MRHFLLFAAVAASLALCVAATGASKLDSREYTASGELLAVRQSEIDRINALGTSWTAGHSERFEGMPLSAARRLMGVKSVKSLPVKKVQIVENLPENFDAREQWGHWCESIGMAWDQGDCGSCWAVSTGGAITDRTCIASNGTVTPWLSYDEINSCDQESSGCDGGDPGSAVDYWVQNGVVTGGPYGNNSDNGAWCDNYQVAPCSHHVVGPLPPCSANEVATPACTQQCQTNGGVWQQYKHFGATSYSLPSDVPSIQSDLFQNGPQIAAFTVYSDFPSYKGGVYQLTPGATELGGHAVRLIGWGTDEASGLPYWLVMNSWNKSWGINGAFKILRGQDECGFEDSIVAGTAKLSSTPSFTATI